MPNITNFKNRVWCKTCQDFTVHEQVFCDETNHAKFSLCTFEEGEKMALICGCNAQYSPVTIGEMDKEKVKQQRERFKKQRREEFRETLGAFGMIGGLGFLQNPLADMFSEVKGIETKILESDAGLKFEEKLLKEQEQIRRNERKMELQRFIHVQRNDICLCGSNLKYKNCCLKKHNTY